jgi:hypothetical protein
MSERSKEKPPHTVRIHIDRKLFESPNPTTGAALYALADVGHHRDLFKEVDGNHEDELIERNDEKVHLKEDDHFYTQKELTIVVNAQPKAWNEPQLGYDQVTHLAFPVPPPSGVVITYTVEYEAGPRQNPEGSLIKGSKPVRVKNGMIFHVTETGRS